MDFECENYIPFNANGAVDDGTLNNSLLVNAAARVLKPWMEVGLMDPPANNPYNYGAEHVDTPAHRQLALEVALQGTTLLQNNPAPKSPNGPNKPVLPLPKTVKKIAVIGPMASAAQAMLGNYSPVNTVVNNQSVLQGIQTYGADNGIDVTYAEGCHGIGCQSSTGFPAAVAAAQDADVAIVVLGLCSAGCPAGTGDWPWSESEGRDRINLTLPNFQVPLALAVAGTGTPVVLILVHGGPVDIGEAKDAIPAILTLFYPGEMGGTAATMLLFGQESPSGRSVMTWCVFVRACVQVRVCVCVCYVRMPVCALGC